MASRKRETQAMEQELSDEEQGSQDIGMELLHAARDMMAVATKRRETKRKAIQDDHLKRTKDVAAKINSLFEKRKNRVYKMQNAQWDRLHALNQKRIVVEAQIIASMTSIEQRTANIRQELHTVLLGRLQDLQITQQD